MTIKYIFNRAHEEEALRTENAILYFTDINSVSCKDFSPILSQIANNYQQFNFFKVDINESKEFADKFQIKSVPKFIVLNKTEYMNENEILSLLQSI